MQKLSATPTASAIFPPDFAVLITGSGIFYCLLDLELLYCISAPEDSQDE